MKKIFALAMALVLIFSMVGCGRTMDDIIQNEPSITGVVTEVYENYFLMLGAPPIGYPTEEYSVSLSVENEDSYTSVSVGDEVTVYYNGKLTDSDPEKMDTIYAITLKTPVNAEINSSSEVIDGNKTQAVRLLSVDIKVLEVVSDNDGIAFKVEAIGNCGEEIAVGDIISVRTDFSNVADILSDHQTNNSFTIYFPFVSEASDGLAVKCMDAIPHTE